VLNPEQMQAVNAREGYWVCQAGPGSGKTRTLVERVHALLNEGYPPENILALTFTREAAAEMARRAKLPEDQKIFRTFHSICLELIHREREKLPFVLHNAPPEPGQQRKLLYTLCRENRLDFKQLVGYISLMKRTAKTHDQAMEEALGAVGLHLAVAYKYYEARSREEGWLDFDGMLIESVNILQNNADVLARWQYQFVLVDEAQDTDDIQWKLVELLSKENKNVFAVGDEEQLIYAWRGAKPDGLSNFATRFPGCRTIYLFRNYRSTRQIVDFCKKFAPKKSELIDRMVSEVGDGPDPIVRRYWSDSDEAAKILGSILDPEHTAILTRTNRQLARFENACIDRGIKYNLLGKSGFWTQPEVKYLLGYTKAVDFPNDAAVKSIIQSPYRVTKYLKKRDLICALQSKAKRELEATGTAPPFIKLMADPEVLAEFNQSQRDNIQKAAAFIKSFRQPSMKPVDALRMILDHADVEAYYENEEESDGDNDAKENIGELSKVAARYNTIPEFLDHARRAIAASRRSRSLRLTLSTVHQAKGKEWDVVYVAGVSKDLLPHKRGDIHEERRIMWVALTRAAKQLTVTFHGTMSEFLEGHWTEDKQKVLDAEPVSGFKGQPGLFEGMMA